MILILAAFGCMRGNSDLSGDTGSRTGQGLMMEIGGELVKVEEMPHLHDDFLAAIPPELGNPEETIALTTGEFLVATTGPPGSRGCLALFSDERRLSTSVCQAETSAVGSQFPIALRIGSFFAMSNLPPEVDVVERGGVFRRVEHGMVYFDESNGSPARYYGVDGSELSAVEAS